MKKSPLGSGSSLGMILCAVVAAVGACKGQDAVPYKIAVNVDLVVLQATVRDHKGRPVPDLGEQNFEVFEDGVRQSIRVFRHEDIPVTIGLVIDHSTSMRAKLSEVVAAASTFVHTSNPEDRLFEVNFNEKVTLGLPAAMHFTNRAEEVELAISKMPAQGMTALYDAVTEGLRRLQAPSLDKKVLIVISDGGDNASKHSLDDVLKMAGQSTALIYTIGIFDEDDADRNPEVLRHLARASGGEAFFPGQLNEVVAICERIARDIRSQYTLGYVPAIAAQPGVYRSIRVAVRDPSEGKLQVRARSGYIAGGEERPIGHEIAK